MSGNTIHTGEGTGSTLQYLSHGAIVLAIAALLAGIYLWWIDDEITLALIAFLPLVSLAFAEPLILLLARLTVQRPWLLVVWFVVAAGLIFVDSRLWQDAQKRISITQVKVVTEAPECQLEISGRYNLYTLACDQPNDCVPFVLFKTAGVDSYYARVELSDKLRERRGNWSVRIDVLTSPTITETKEQGWCRNPIFDPQKPFDVYVALAPQGWWNKFMDCMPANQGIRTNDPPVQGLDFLSEGIRMSCANR
jgi:hypothetical protein